MTRRFCDICDKEVSTRVFSVLVEAQVPAPIATVASRRDVCGECKDRVLEALQPPPREGR